MDPHHFIFESEKYRGHALALVQSAAATLAAFEELIGPVDSVQAEWHDYVRQLKVSLVEKERGFFQQRRMMPKPFEPLDGVKRGKKAN